MYLCIRNAHLALKCFLSHVIVKYGYESLSHSLQLDLWTLLASVLSATPTKPLPRWLPVLLLRGILLLGFTVAIMVLRVKIMKAELPVFTM